MQKHMITSYVTTMKCAITCTDASPASVREFSHEVGH